MAVSSTYFHVCLSRLFVTSVCHVCLSRLSVTSVCHVCLSRLSVTSVCHVCLSRLSVTSVCHVCLSRLSVTSVCHVCLSRLSVTSVCLWFSGARCTSADGDLSCVCSPHCTVLWKNILSSQKHELCNGCGGRGGT